MYEAYTTVTGNLIGAVTGRRLADGTSVVNFRVAGNERRRDRAGGWRDGDRLYVSVTCWRRLADNVVASFVAGDPIIVHGRLYSRDYEENGVRQWVTEMEGLAVGPDLTRCTATVRRRRAGAAEAGHDGQAVGDSGGSSAYPGDDGGMDRARPGAMVAEATVGMS